MHRLILLASLAAGPCLADNTFIVNSTSNEGAGTLRAAINQMQPGNGTQTIRFVLPGDTQITTLSMLPPLIGQSIVLDATQAPGLVLDAQGGPLLRFLVGNSSQTIQVLGLNLRNGSSGEGGGCIDVRTQGTLQVFDSTFEGCINFGPAATGAGGGAIRTNGSLRLTRTRFSDNQSTDWGIVTLVNAGGAVRVSGGTSVLIERTQFVSNKTVATPASAQSCVGGQGGALSLELPAGANALLRDVQFIDNATTCLSTGSRQAGDGGALAVYGQGLSSLVLLERTWFGQNEARNGGAANIESARLDVINSTFFENTALATGGIYLLTRTGNPPTTANIRNSTFARGSANFGSFAAYLQTQNGATVSEIRNTVFAKPLSGPACAPNAIDVQAGDTVFTGSASCFFYTPGNNLISLELPNNNFGLTRVEQTHGWVPTLAMPAGSVLIDNGSNPTCPATDARGLPRPVNGGFAMRCDVGAVEYNPDRIFATGFER